MMKVTIMTNQSSFRLRNAGFAAVCLLTTAASVAEVAPSFDILVFPPQDPSAGASDSRAATVTNNTGDAVTLTSDGFVEGAEAGYTVSDGCAGQTLAAGQSCVASFVFDPAGKGMRTATYRWRVNNGGAPVEVHMTNRYGEGVQDEALRRVPPAIEAVEVVALDANGVETSAGNTLHPGTNYRLRWYAVGYDADVSTYAALFDCGPNSAPVAQCGASIVSAFVLSNSLTATVLTAQQAVDKGLPVLSYSGQTATHLQYSLDFNLGAIASAFDSEARTLVARIYYTGGLDRDQRRRSVSLLLPGGLNVLEQQGDQNYYDTEGRRLRLPASP